MFAQQQQQQPQPQLDANQHHPLPQIPQILVPAPIPPPPMPPNDVFDRLKLLEEKVGSLTRALEEANRAIAVLQETDRLKHAQRELTRLQKKKFRNPHYPNPHHAPPPPQHYPSPYAPPHYPQYRFY